MPAAVSAVPTTPTTSTGTAAVRKRAPPMCRPPSKSSSTSITVTTRWTVTIGIVPSEGTTSEAIAAAHRKSAGAGMRIRSLSRLDHTASSPAMLNAATATPKGSTSSMAHLRARIASAAHAA